MNQSLSCKIIALLAFLQGLFGLLRGYNWIQIGSDLFGQGLLLLPAIGAVAFLRGCVIGVIALLYILFSVGMASAKTWAWWPGLTAAIANLIFVLSALVHGASIGEAIVWSVVPVVLIFQSFYARTPSSEIASEIH